MPGPVGGAAGPSQYHSNGFLTTCPFGQITVTGVADGAQSPTTLYVEDAEATKEVDEGGKLEVAVLGKATGIDDEDDNTAIATVSLTKAQLAKSNERRIIKIWW